MKTMASWAHIRRKETINAPDGPEVLVARAYLERAPRGVAIVQPRNMRVCRGDRGSCTEHQRS